MSLPHNWVGSDTENPPRQAAWLNEVEQYVVGGSLSYVAAGTSVSSIQATLNALVPGDICVLNPGSYNFGTTTLLVPPGIIVWAYGAVISSAVTSTAYPQNGAIRLDSLAAAAFAASTATSLTLTADTTEGALTLSLSSSDAATLSANDEIEISDTSALNTVNNHRERNIVSGVSGTTVTLKYPLNFAYATANAAALTRLAGSQSVSTGTRWYGGTVDLSGAASGSVNGIIGTYMNDCAVEDFTAKNFRGAAVELWAGINVRTRNVRGLYPTAVTAGLGYGTRLQYCRFSKMENTYGESVRHIMDMTGGSDNVGSGVYGGGRTTDTAQCGAFLHGLESKRCRYERVAITNMVTALGAGNGTFGSDYDFTFDGFEINQCDDSISISQACTGFRIANGNVFNSNIRAVAHNSGSSGDYENITVDGVLTNPSNYGAIDINGTSGDYVRVRNCWVARPIYHSYRVTGGGTVDLLDCGCVSTAAQPPVHDPAFTGKLTIDGGTYIKNAASQDCIWLSSSAALLVVKNTTLIALEATNSGIHDQAAATHKVFQNNTITGFSECIRIEKDNASVRNNTLSGSTCIRLAGTFTSVILENNTPLSGTAISNTATGGAVNTSAAKVAPTYSSSITPVAAQGPWQTITATNNTAFTVNAPTSVPDSAHSAELTVEVLNSSGGAMGAITWNAAFIFNGFTWANPASTKKRFVTFKWNGSAWIAIAMSTVDY